MWIKNHLVLHICYFRLKVLSSKTKTMGVDELLPDFPPGPLDIYRKQASFDWKKLKLLLEDEEITGFKVILNLFPNIY
jgi:hypothetical protein